MAFKAALIQMRVEGGAKQRNLAHAEALIAEAAAQGAALAVLPEIMDLGWTHPSCRAEAEPIPAGASCTRLMNAAARHGIAVCAGLTERAGDNVYNAAVLIDAAGTLLCRHRKLNELAIGHDCYDQGDRLNVAQTEHGTWGLMICADGFARDQVLSRALGYMGADVILSPSAWAVPADHDQAKEPYGALWRRVYKAVAAEFSLWVIGVSNVGPIEAGPWAGHSCIGCSLVIGPDGNDVLQGPYGVDAEAILYVDIEPRQRPARGCGWTDHWAASASPPAPAPTLDQKCGFLKDIRIVSTADGSEQPALFYAPDTPTAVPLLVALHTWSTTYQQPDCADCAQWCKEHGWAFIHPEFRGPNLRPEATGSEAAVADIVDAVAYARQAACIDASAVFLLGASGGGHAALLMAGRHPELWTAVSAWVPVSDLAAWHAECQNAGRHYDRDIVASCGGAPGQSPAIDEEYHRRSPLTYLPNAGAVPLHINAGIRDGHDGSVPISHSLRAFNAVAAPADRIAASDIRFMTDHAAVPPHLQAPIEDSTYGDRRPLFRRSSGQVTVTIFDGGHERVDTAAMTWLQGFAPESRRVDEGRL